MTQPTIKRLVTESALEDKLAEVEAARVPPIAFDTDGVPYLTAEEEA